MYYKGSTDTRKFPGAMPRYAHDISDQWETSGLADFNSQGYTPFHAENETTRDKQWLGKKFILIVY